MSWKETGNANFIDGCKMPVATCSSEGHDSEFYKNLQDCVRSSFTEDSRKDYLQVIKKKRTIYLINAKKSTVRKNCSY